MTHPPLPPPTFPPPTPEEVQAGREVLEGLLSRSREQLDSLMSSKWALEKHYDDLTKDISANIAQRAKVSKQVNDLKSTMRYIKRMVEDLPS